MKFKKIGILAVVLIATLAPLFGVLAATAPIENPAPLFFVKYPGDGSFQSIFGFVISNILLPLVSIITVLFIILGGFRYITAGTDTEAAESGKKMLSNAVIGLVMIVFSYLIVKIAITAIRGQV